MHSQQSARGDQVEMIRKLARLSRNRRKRGRVDILDEGQTLAPTHTLYLMVCQSSAPTLHCNQVARYPTTDYAAGGIPLPVEGIPCTGTSWLRQLPQYAERAWRGVGKLPSWLDGDMTRPFSVRAKQQQSRMLEVHCQMAVEMYCGCRSVLVRDTSHA